VNEYPLVFDNHDLTKLFGVEWPITRSAASWEPSVVDVPGRNGAVFGGTKAQPMDVSMRLWTLAETREQRQQDVRTLAAWLAVDGPRPLYLGDEGGLWRMAIPAGNMDVSAYLNAESIPVTFRCLDPVLYGDRAGVEVPSGGSVTFLVGGTAPTFPTVTASSAHEDGTAGYWRLWLDEQTHLDADTGASSVPVSADCERRVLTVNGDVQMLNPFADWLRLTPGTHTIRMVGTGAASVQWVERWW